jgi:FkbM family methyltransferase
MPILSTIWLKSPKDVFDSIKRKIFKINLSPKWHVIKSGPLKGGQLFVDAGAFNGWVDMIEGRFDSFIYDELGPSLDINGATVWDIGAHFGYHSFSFASLVGDTGHVYSFEPNPDNIARFEMHLVKNPLLAERITLNRYALSDQNGEMVFVLSKEIDGSSSSGSHLLNGNPPLEANAYKKFSKQIVKTFKIDTLVKNKDIMAADIVKIDVEGAEALVLNGGSDFIKMKRPIIFIEIHNIAQMFYVQKFLLGCKYEIKLLNEIDATKSKCFIMAKPTKHLII